MIRSHSDLKKENKLLLKRITNFEKKEKIFKKEVNDLEQYGRREMVELSGIRRKDAIRIRTNYKKRFIT